MYDGDARGRPSGPGLCSFDGRPRNRAGSAAPALPPLGSAGRPLARAGAAPAARTRAPGTRPLTDLAGGGRATAAGAPRRWASTPIGDLLEHLPVALRGLRRGAPGPSPSLVRGEEATVRVRLGRDRRAPDAPAPPADRARPASDATGAAVAMWFNQDTWPRILAPGDELLLRGRVGRGRAAASWWSRPTSSSGARLGGAATPRAWCRSTRPPSSMPPAASASWSTWRGPWRAAPPERLPAWIRRRLGLPGGGGRAGGGPLPALAPPRRASAGAAWCWRSSSCSSSGCWRVRRREDRARARRRRCAATGERCRRRCSRRCPFTLTAEQRRVGARDRPRPARARGRCGGCCRARSASGKTRRRRARHLPGGRGRGARPRCWCPPRRSPSSTCRTLDAAAGAGRAGAGARSPARSRAPSASGGGMALAHGHGQVAVGTQALLSEGVGSHRLGPRRGGRAAPLRRGAAPGCSPSGRRGTGATRPRTCST